MKYLVVFIGRCGGTWLFRMLNEHPEIHPGYEVFDDQGKAVETIEDRWASVECQSAGASGALMKHLYIEKNPGIMACAKAHGASIIVLQRTNVVKHALSILIGDMLHQLRGSREVYKDEDRPGALHIDTGVLLQYLAQSLEVKFKLARWAHENADYFLTYEDLLSHTDEAYRKLCEFLQVASISTPEVTLKKITRDSLADAIENYTEAFLWGIGFEEYLR